MLTIFTYSTWNLTYAPELSFCKQKQKRY